MQQSLFTTGIRPIIDDHLLNLASERRNYGDYWSGSSAGYCMRKVIYDRLQVPYVRQEPRTQRVFSVGQIFHEWIQGLTRAAGISAAQEGELIDDKLMVKGHFDDLVVIDGSLVLYDYKTSNSRSFAYKHDMSHYHRMQLATYMYMLKQQLSAGTRDELSEGRILIISKDDLRMKEQQLIYTPALEKEVVGYWRTLNGYWKKKILPKCTCEQYENGFLARQKWNDYYYQGEPCSAAWIKEMMKEVAMQWDIT